MDDCKRREAAEWAVIGYSVAEDFSPQDYSDTTFIIVFVRKGEGGGEVPNTALEVYCSSAACQIFDDPCEL